jgi:MFS family permease
VALLLGITKANSWGWLSPKTLALLVGGALVLVFFTWLQRRTRDPLVDIGVLAQRAVLATNVTAFLVGVAMFGSFLLIPQFAETAKENGYGFGMSVTQAGLVMLPSAASMLLAGPIGGSLGTRLGFRLVLALGSVLAAASFALLAALHDGVWAFLVAGVLLGFGISFAFAAMANLVVAAVDPGEVGIATGINTIARTVGGAFGAAMVTALLTAETISGSNGVPTENAYTEAFLFSAVGALLALAACLTIPRARSQEQPAREEVEVVAA